MTEGAGCRSVEELPAYRECAGVGRRAHPGYPVEPGPPEIVAVVVHRERSDLESDVAPEESRSLDGGRDAGGARPRFHPSMLIWSLRLKIPLRKVGRNLLWIVALTIEWVGGCPSGRAPCGVLYQPSRTSHCLRAVPAVIVTP